MTYSQLHYYLIAYHDVCAGLRGEKCRFLMINNSTMVYPMKMILVPNCFLEF